MANASLTAAKNAKNDEFYTQYHDIEREINAYLDFNPDAQSLDMLHMAMERMSLSARAYSRILKVACTIADLDGSDRVGLPHIAETVGYRNLDRGDWAERKIL